MSNDLLDAYNEQVSENRALRQENDRLRIELEELKLKTKVLVDRDDERTNKVRVVKSELWDSISKLISDSNTTLQSRMVLYQAYDKLEEL